MLYGVLKNLSYGYFTDCIVVLSPISVLKTEKNARISVASPVLFFYFCLELGLTT